MIVVWISVVCLVVWIFEDLVVGDVEVGCDIGWNDWLFGMLVKVRVRNG